MMMMMMMIDDDDDDGDDDDDDGNPLRLIFGYWSTLLHKIFFNVS